MRVLLRNLPPLLRDVLSEALASEQDIAVVGEAPSGEIETVAGESSPDVVVIRAPREVAKKLFDSLRVATVVAIDPRGEHAIVFSPDFKPVELKDVSPTAIIGAIRRG